MGNGLVHAGDDLHREDVVEKLHFIVVFAGGHGLREDGTGARAAAQFHVFLLQPRGDDRQRRFGDGLVHQQRLQRVAHRGARGLGVEYDLRGHGDVGGLFHIGVAVAHARLDHRHGGVLHHGADQPRAAAGDEQSI